MLSVGIVGATGYTGIQCVNLCLNHPELNINHLYAYSNVGQKTESFFPNVSALPAVFEAFDPDSSFSDIDVLFLAVPHATTHAFMDKLTNKDLKIIDISADFRLNSASLFQQYYDVEHQSSQLCKSIPYGLPEVYASAIKKADIVANPGCFSTATILGLYPLTTLDFKPISIIVDAKTGVSGAGRVLKQNFLYCEVNETVTAYNTAKHRHQAEMDEQLGWPMLFSPHLLPMSRGILASMYVSFDNSVDFDRIIATYEAFYKDSPFTSVSLSAPVSTKPVIGSNSCLRLEPVPDKNQLIVFSMIDNLLKGAAGQAVQNMNLMCGFEETLGLPKMGPLV